jgi:hypothetical protein
MMLHENKAGASARITGFEQRLKLTSNGLKAQTSPDFKLRGGHVRGCGFYAVSALGPSKIP